MPKDKLERPEDLITTEKAAKMAGEKKDTIHGWVRNGTLTGYRKDPTNKFSTLMVSCNELQLYLGTKAQVAHPNNTGRPLAPSVSLVDKDKEIEQLKKGLEAYQAKCDSLQDELVQVRTFTDRLQIQLESRDIKVSGLQDFLKSVMELQSDLRDDNRQLQADNRRLTSYVSLPWWKKIGSTLLLTDKKES